MISFSTTISELSVCACIMWRCAHTSTWGRLGLARNVNLIIRGMYLGITCGLSQPREFWESGGSVMRIVSCMNWLHSGGATLPSGGNSHLYKLL